MLAAIIDRCVGILSINYVAVTDIEPVLAALCRRPTLRSIELAYAVIRPPRAAELIKALPNLTYLNLENTKLFKRKEDGQERWTVHTVGAAAEWCLALGKDLSEATCGYTDRIDLDAATLASACPNLVALTVCNYARPDLTSLARLQSIRTTFDTLPEAALANVLRSKASSISLSPSIYHTWESLNLREFERLLDTHASIGKLARTLHLGKAPLSSQRRDVFTDQERHDAVAFAAEHNITLSFDD